MATLLENVQRITQTFTNIKNALINKGFPPSGDVTTYAQAIDEIQTGVDISDTTATADDVTSDVSFYTADGEKMNGTIVKSSPPKSLYSDSYAPASYSSKVVLSDDAGNWLPTHNMTLTNTYNGKIFTMDDNIVKSIMPKGIALNSLSYFWSNGTQSRMTERQIIGEGTRCEFMMGTGTYDNGTYNLSTFICGVYDDNMKFVVTSAIVNANNSIGVNAITNKQFEGATGRFSPYCGTLSGSYSIIAITYQPILRTSTYEYLPNMSNIKYKTFNGCPLSVASNPVSVNSNQASGSISSGSTITVRCTTSGYYSAAFGIFVTF